MPERDPKVAAITKAEKAFHRLHEPNGLPGLLGILDRAGIPLVEVRLVYGDTQSLIKAKNDRISQLEKEASYFIPFRTFETAANSIGYKTLRQIADVIHVSVSDLRDWRDMDQLPVFYMKTLQDAPNLRRGSASPAHSLVRKVSPDRTPEQRFAAALRNKPDDIRRLEECVEQVAEEIFRRGDRTSGPAIVEQVVAKLGIRPISNKIVPVVRKRLTARRPDLESVFRRRR